MYNDDWRPDASVNEPRRAERSARSVSSRSREAVIGGGECGSRGAMRGTGRGVAIVGAEINQEPGEE